MNTRQFRHFAQGSELEKFSPEDKKYGAHIMPVDSEHPVNAIISGPETGDACELHMPLLDDDAGLFRIVPSRSNGHQHIYIEKAIPWSDFVRLLKLMAELQLVDSNWADLCIKQRTATLRWEE